MIRHNYLFSISKQKVSITTLFFMLILVVHELNAQTIKGRYSFDSIIKAHTYIIEFDGKEVSGSGADWLVEEADRTNYFLVGERHGTANIPNLSGAIYSKIMKAGYNHAALEIGQYAALETQELLKKGGYEALKNYLEQPQYFQAIAFLDWAEESMLAARIAQESPLREKAIIGLDQEFIFGFKMYLERLEKMANIESQKQFLKTITSKLKENRFLLGSPIKEELEKMKSLFSDNLYAINLIDALLVSNKIYGRFRGELSRIASSTLREHLMKKNLVSFVTDYERHHEETPKIFFKFGGFHAAPSLGNGKSTLGTFVEEWALSRDESAFNLYIDAVSGKTLVSGQDNEQGGEGTLEVISYFGSLNVNEVNSEDKHVFVNELNETNSLFLIDLRPLRNYLDELKPFLNTKAIKLITGFDSYLAIPNVIPGTPFKKK